MSASQSGPGAPVGPQDYNFNPAGVDALEAILRTHTPLQNFPAGCIRAAAIALIVHGCHRDGRHYIANGTLCTEHYAAHANNADKRHEGLNEEHASLLMDLITAGDRVSGGTSFYVSTQGTRPPNTLSVVSEMKMNVYIAPQVLQRFPHTKITYSRMVQQFAVEIAVHMVRRRELAKKVPSPTIVEPTMRGIRQPLIPQSTTPWHVFYGRPPGVLESLISAQLGSLPVFTPQDESPPVSTPSPPALQASLPALPASLPVPPSLNVFAKGNEVAKEPSQGLGSDVWDISDVKSGKDSEAWLDAGQRGKGGDPALGGKLTSGRMPEVCNLVVALEKRVEELEQINRAHEHELASLRQVFKDVLDEHDAENQRIRQAASRPAPSTPSTPSALTFGHVSQHDGEIAQIPSSLSRRSSPAKRSLPPKPSRSQISRTTSTSPISSVSCVALSLSSEGTYEGRWARPGNTTPTPTSPSNASWSPIKLSALNTISDEQLFGVNTDYFILSHLRPRSDHAILYTIESQYGQNIWATVLRAVLKLSPEEAEIMAHCMRQDACDRVTAESADDEF